jgi:hypothetical protein
MNLGVVAPSLNQGELDEDDSSDVRSYRGLGRDLLCGGLVQCSGRSQIAPVILLKGLKLESIGLLEMAV